MLLPNSKKKKKIHLERTERSIVRDREDSADLGSGLRRRVDRQQFPQENLKLQQRLISSEPTHLIRHLHL